MVIDETDELTILQQRLGRKTKERWSDSLLKRNEIKPLIPPLQIISGVLRPKAKKQPLKKTVAQTILAAKAKEAKSAKASSGISQKDYKEDLKKFIKQKKIELVKSKEPEIKRDYDASFCTQVHADTLKEGFLVVIKGFPCKIYDIYRINIGKGGRAKVVVKGKDIFTNKEYECSFSSGNKVDAPIVKTSEYVLVNIDD